ncbi:putative DNA topoisomerase (ATP-hydrolyzing) [Rosa chinensis]|uniref:Putative DNA topoisomerase (ATP-hydrolyzing) n=1 Tax=Rosa chinensis TaxID=74649 RepID=A0A2P6RMU2_ROSCH|nr:putative DNA topoisomerase (ATP-hydrolyzing) [Rosa chinensis]
MYYRTFRKEDIILGFLHLILIFCNGHKRCTLRSLYYLDTKLFEQQTLSDSALDDICCIIGCSCSSLNVFASDRGYVGGVLTFRLDDHQFDCRRMGPYGQPIPPFIDDRLMM